MKVLHIGIKNWPFDSAFSNATKRGGGSNKYTNILINGYSDHIESYIITQFVEGQKKEEIYPNGIKVFRVKTYGGRKVRLLIFNLFSIFLAIKVLSKIKIDVIHGHILPGIIGSHILGKFFNIPVIGTPYNIYEKTLKYPLNKIAGLLEKYFYSSIDKIVFETEENRAFAIKTLNNRFANSVVINTGVNVPLIKYENDIKQKPLRVLFIGRLVKVKALDNLICSLIHLDNESRKNIFIDIVGEGEEKDYLNLLVNKHNLYSYVKIHGFVNDIDEFMRKANIFILPSYTEGLSIALLEAMSNGLTCIVNNFGVPFTSSEVFVMDNNNAETIALSLKYFISNPEEIKKYGINAFTKIDKDFSINAFIKKYISNYRRLIKNN